jgi:hypothetical protein
MLDQKTTAGTPGPLRGAFFVFAISGGPDMAPGFTISGDLDMAPGLAISGGPDMAPALPQSADFRL